MNFREKLTSPRSLYLGVLLVNLIVASAMGYVLFKSLETHQEYAQTQTQNLAETLMHSLRGNIEKIDIGLLAVKDEIEQQIATGRPDRNALAAYMTEMQHRMPWVIGLRATDAEGWVTYGVDVPVDRRVSNADRPHFLVHRDDSRHGLFFGKPVLSRINQVWVINFSHRLNYPDGRFAGDVFANVPLENFRKLFGVVDVGRKGVVNLRYGDMGLLVRQPSIGKESDLIGKVDISPDFRRMLDAGNMAGGVFFSPTSFDGSARTVSYRKVGEYPLYVSVGLAEEDYLADWHGDVLWMLAALVSFMLFSFGGAHMIARSWRVRLADAERLAVSEEKFHTVADFTHDWEYWQGLDGGILYMAPSCERITGYAADEFIADPGLLLRIVHPDDRPMMNEHRCDAVQGEANELDFRILRRDGEERWINHRCRRIMPKDGVYRGVRVSNRDISDRHLFEAEINRLAQAVEQSPTGMCLTDADGVLLFTNHAYTLITGYSFAEAYGMTRRNLISDVLPDDLYAEISGKLASGKVWSGTIPSRSKGGADIWLRLSVSPIYDQAGKVSNYLYLRQDITEQVRADKALRSSRSELQQLLLNLPVAVVVHGADTAIRFSNPLAQKILGLTEDQLLGRTAMDPYWHFICEDGSALPLPEYPVSRVLASRQDISGMVLGIVVSQGATPRWVYVSAFADYDDRDEIRQVVVSFMDISEQVRNESILRESEARLALALESANGAWWEWNFKTGETVYSARYYRMLGYEPDEFPASYAEWRKRVHPDDLPMAEAFLQRHLMQDKTDYNNLEMRMLRKDGKWVWLVGSGKIVQRDSENNPVRLVGTNIDITVLKEAEQTLIQRTADLTRAHADLMRFADVSAHHLMEPTRRLMVYADRLRPRLAACPELQQDAEVTNTLAVLERESMRLRNLVRDIQLYLAAAQPRGELHLTEVGPVVQAIQQRLAVRIGEAGASLVVGELPAAFLDTPRLNDLFTLLLDNSLKYGYPIDAAVSLLITIDGERGDGLSRYRIADNGPGIPEEYRERVFEIFERLSSGGEGGSGIGLSIARRIVESRRGRIWIESGPLGGCAVIFELPDGEAR